jgi:hypothetical protein
VNRRTYQTGACGCVAGGSTRPVKRTDDETDQDNECLENVDDEVTTQLVGCEGPQGDSQEVDATVADQV